jgi:hypothetical protein
MTETITLRLTCAEALALDALVDNSAETFFGVVGGDKQYRLDGWTKKEAAQACDKLRTALYTAAGETLPEKLTWSAHLQQLDQ